MAAATQSGNVAQPNGTVIVAHGDGSGAAGIVGAGCRIPSTCGDIVLQGNVACAGRKKQDFAIAELASSITRSIDQVFSEVGIGWDHQ